MNIKIKKYNKKDPLIKREQINLCKTKRKLRTKGLKINANPNLKESK